MCVDLKIFRLEDYGYGYTDFINCKIFIRCYVGMKSNIETVRRVSKICSKINCGRRWAKIRDPIEKESASQEVTERTFLADR